MGIIKQNLRKNVENVKAKAKKLREAHLRSIVEEAESEKTLRM